MPRDRSETALGPRYGPGDRLTVTSSRQLATPSGEIMRGSTMPTVKFTGQLGGCDSIAKLLIGICILSMVNVHFRSVVKSRFLHLTSNTVCYYYLDHM